MLLCPCVWVPNKAERLVEGWHILEVTGVGLGVSGLCSVLCSIMSELRAIYCLFDKGKDREDKCE